MGFADEAAGSLAAAVDSIHPEQLAGVVDELQAAYGFVAAAGDAYAAKWGPAIQQGIHTIQQASPMLEATAQEIREESLRLQAGG